MFGRQFDPRSLTYRCMAYSITPNTGVDDAVGDERSWFKLSVKDGLLFEDVLLTVYMAVGPFGLEDDGCV